MSLSLTVSASQPSVSPLQICSCRCRLPLLCVTVFSCKLGFLFFFPFVFFFFLEWIRIQKSPSFFFPFISWVFPTPRLHRYLIKTGSDFFFCVCCLGLIFIGGLIFFLQHLKISIILLRGASVILLKQIAKNNILYILKFFFENLGGATAPPGPRIAPSLH